MSNFSKLNTSSRIKIKNCNKNNNKMSDNTFLCVLLLTLASYVQPLMTSRGRECPPGEIVAEKPEGWVCIQDLSYRWSTRRIAEPDDPVIGWGSRGPERITDPAPVFGFDAWIPETTRTTTKSFRQQQSSYSR